MRRAERTCPFCDAALRETGAPLAAALSLASLLVGCSDTPPTETDGGGTQTTTTATEATDSLSGSGSVQTSGSSGPFETTAVDDDTTTMDAPTGGGFIYGDPETGGPMVIECDVYMQDCPDGEKCMPWANDGGDEWNATQCTPISDRPAEPGEPCTVEGGPTSGIDSCAASAMCWQVDPGTNMGNCIAMCTGSADMPVCEDPGTQCVVFTADVLALCGPPR